MSDADADGADSESGGENNIPLVYTGQDRSQIPRDVTHVIIDPSVKVIDEGAFFHCEQLVEVVLCEGLNRIEACAFMGCSSLKYAKIPSSVKVIDKETFRSCKQLLEVVLCEGLNRIEAMAFRGCSSLNHIKIPSTVKVIGVWSFRDCEQLVEVELCEGLEQIKENAFQNCYSLRNLVIPSTAQASDTCFIGCYNLQMLFGSQEKIECALKSRFVGLPIHELCYHQSQHPAELMIEELNNLINATSYHSGASLDTSRKTMDNNQDCLGMTPLHILACSTQHNLDLYRIMIANQPGSLIVEDKWGCLPILYAIWGNAPKKIMQILNDAQLSAFPDIDLNWDRMIATLCRAGASIDIITRLLQIQNTSFFGQSINWQKAAHELTIHCLIRCGTSFQEFSSIWGSLMAALSSSQTHQELLQRLSEFEQHYFPDLDETNWQMVCEEFVLPLNGWWNSDSLHYASLGTFQFLVKCNIPDRLSVIGVKKWRLNILNLAADLAPVYNPSARSALFDTMHSNLLTYEHEYPLLKDAISLLELALWKTKFDESVLMHRINVVTGNQGQVVGDNTEEKRQCRVTCGANVIIPNVLPYLTG